MLRLESALATTPTLTWDAFSPAPSWDPSSRALSLLALNALPASSPMGPNHAPNAAGPALNATVLEAMGAHPVPLSPRHQCPPLLSHPGAGSPLVLDGSAAVLVQKDQAQDAIAAHRRNTVPSKKRCPSSPTPAANSRAPHPQQPLRPHTCSSLSSLTPAESLCRQSEWRGISWHTSQMPGSGVELRAGAPLRLPLLLDCRAFVLQQTSQYISCSPFI